MEEIEKLKKQKDNAYWERNQLVSALSRLFPSFLSKHPEEDKEWDDDWRTIVIIKLPTNKAAEKEINQQLSWHIHDTDIPMFDHLQYRDFGWDGHTTEEKYRRLRDLIFNPK